MMQGNQDSRTVHIIGPAAEKMLLQLRKKGNAVLDLRKVEVIRVIVHFLALAHVRAAISLREEVPHGLHDLEILLIQFDVQLHTVI